MKKVDLASRWAGKEYFDLNISRVFWHKTDGWLLFWREEKEACLLLTDSNEKNLMKQLQTQAFRFFKYCEKKILIWSPRRVGGGRVRVSGGAGSPPVPPCWGALEVTHDTLSLITDHHNHHHWLLIIIIITVAISESLAISLIRHCCSYCHQMSHDHVIKSHPRIRDTSSEKRFRHQEFYKVLQFSRIKIKSTQLIIFQSEESILLNSIKMLHWQWAD